MITDLLGHCICSLSLPLLPLLSLLTLPLLFNRSPFHSLSHLEQWHYYMCRKFGDSLSLLHMIIPHSWIKSFSWFSTGFFLSWSSNLSTKILFLSLPTVIVPCYDYGGCGWRLAEYRLQDKKIFQTLNLVRKFSHSLTSKSMDHVCLRMKDTSSMQWKKWGGDWRGQWKISIIVESIKNEGRDWFFFLWKVKRCHHKMTAIYMSARWSTLVKR